MLHNGYNAIALKNYQFNGKKQFNIEAGKSYPCYEGFGGYVVWFGTTAVMLDWNSFSKYFKLSEV